MAHADATARFEWRTGFRCTCMSTYRCVLIFATSPLSVRPIRKMSSGLASVCHCHHDAGTTHTLLTHRARLRGCDPAKQRACVHVCSGPIASRSSRRSRNAAWSYLQGATTEDLATIGSALARTRIARSRLTYASAQWFLDIAQGRRDPELLAEAIRHRKPSSSPAPRPRRLDRRLPRFGGGCRTSV